MFATSGADETANLGQTDVEALLAHQRAEELALRVDQLDRGLVLHFLKDQGRWNFVAVAVPHARLDEHGMCAVPQPDDPSRGYRQSPVIGVMLAMLFVTTV